MPKPIPALAVVICLLPLLSSCNQKSEPQQQPPAPAPPQSTSSTKPSSIPPAVGWKKTTLISPLEHPWGLAFLPDGGMLITERPGRLRLVRDGKLQPQPIGGVPAVAAIGQGGLLDIALHPDFAQNQLIYFTYAAGTESANHTTLGRGRLEGSQLVDVKVLFQAQPSKPGGQHFGSVLLWLPDKTLLMSIGDGGNPPLMVDGILARENAQRLDRHLGKILRLDAEGKAPADNPFVGREGTRPEIYTYGNRNIQGLTRDPQSGRIFATEHGPYGGDELNLIVAGGNYGWPLASFGRDYRTKEPVSPNTSLPNMLNPREVWSPSKAPSGLLFYSGDKFPQWRGQILSGGQVSMDIRAIKFDGEKVTGQQSIQIGRRLREIVLGPDGFIYILTDHKDGELMRIEPGS
jgi:aldose sugar dehydrogenase